MIIFEAVHHYSCGPLGSGIRDLDSSPTKPTSCDLKRCSELADIFGQKMLASTMFVR